MAFLTTQTVAKLLGVTTDNVRYLERTGHLLAIRLERGTGQIQRLFLEEDVQRFQQQREARTQARLAKQMRKQQEACPGKALAVVPPDD
jgi:excisionase family DNA binding protein